MGYLNIKSNISGAYSAPQSSYAPGLVEIGGEYLGVFYQYRGFVYLEIEDNKVVGISPNTEAFDTYMLEHPDIEEEPTEAEPTVEELVYTLLGVN